MSFPIRTERLVLRPMIESDAAALWERRNLPDVAAYQTWTTPYPREHAERVAAEVMAMDGPEDGEWWMLTIADPATDEPMGDLAIHLLWQGRSAEIGYTLHPDHWGHGLALEAAGALTGYAFDILGVTRLFATLHPDNRASAQLLERLGMLFEGHTRSSFWVGDVVSDDWIYGMTRDDWQEWVSRPTGEPAAVELVEVTGDLYTEVYSLRTHKTQEAFVAPMPRSLAQALLAPSHSVHPSTPWYRAIEADGVIAGFVMLALPTDEDPEPFLWRLLIDRMHQRRGIGSRAMDLVEETVAAWGHDSLMTSWVPGRGSPEPFYLGRGFEPTGEIDEDGEVVARKRL